MGSKVQAIGEGGYEVGLDGEDQMSLSDVTADIDPRQVSLG